MNRITIRLLIAMLTFFTGVASFTTYLFLRSPLPKSSDSERAAHIISVTPLIPVQERPYSSRYVNPADDDGLYYVVRRPAGLIMDPEDGFDERSLVLAYDDKPIKPIADAPDSPTFPGFYLPNRVRFAFEKVEVNGKKVYFSTCSVGGVNYEFSGTFGREALPDSAPTMTVPFIKGILKRLGNGKLESEEEIKFRRI